MVELGNMQGRDWNSEEPQHRVEEQTVVSAGDSDKKTRVRLAVLFSWSWGSDPGLHCAGVNARCLTTMVHS